MKKMIFLATLVFITAIASANELNKNKREAFQLMGPPQKTESIIKTKGKQSLDYNTAVGVRFGWEGGITLKHFISGDRAIEGIISSGYAFGGIRLTGLYEIHATAFDVERLSWFYGFGAHIGYGRYGRDRWGGHNFNYFYRYNGPVIGVDGILGMEYHIQDIPFSVSLDIKPSIDIIGWDSGHFGDFGALSIRYVIK